MAKRPATSQETGKRPRNQEKIFNDPIWGPIRLNAACVKIIDTPEFQRLRFIKQLGGGSFLYPGACHTRFEHSIGTSYLAGKLVRILKQNLNKEYDIDITDRDILCVEIAGLCHDLGHGAFSHSFEKDFINSKRRIGNNQEKSGKWKHEHASIQMLDRIFDNFDDDELKKLKNDFDLNLGEDSEEREFIKGLIVGKGTGLYSNEKEKKHFLYEIVANDKNSIDVDKWDYFSRDCHMLGLKHNFQIMRSIMLARVIKHGEKYHISFPKKEYMNIFDMFQSRYTLHRRAYQHPVKEAVENMIGEALCLANEKLLYSGKDGATMKLSKTIEDMKAYSLVTDDVIHRIRFENDSDDDIKKAKKIIDRIFRHDFYKCVAERQITRTRPHQETEGEKDIQDPLKSDKIYLKIVAFDFGSKADKADNPMNKVYFYEDDEQATVKEDEIPATLPKAFEQKYLRLYWKSSLAANEIEVKRAIEWFNTLKEIKVDDEIAVLKVLKRS